MNNYQFSNDADIDYYNRNALSYFEQTVHLDMSSIYPSFLALIPKSGHILDAGCGSGRDTKYFLDLGYKVTAIDASKEMVRLSSEFTKQSTFHLSFQKLNFHNIFDGIWACASLVHAPYYQIGSIIKRFSTAIKPRGVIYISLKVGDGKSIVNNRTFFKYTESSFKDLLSSQSNLQIEKLWITGDLKPNSNVTQWLNILLLKRSINNVI